MRLRSPLPVFLVGLLLVGGGALSPAFADGTKEVRKQFREAQSKDDWKARREAYLGIADYDSAEVVDEILAAMAREENPAVIQTGIDVLAGFATQEAQAELVARLHKGRSSQKTFVLLALARQRGDAAVPALLETAKGKDEQAAAQAALALGRKQVESAVPVLLALLGHRDWQVRRAAAMALRSLAQPPPPKPKPGKEAPKKDVKMPVPGFMKAPEVTRALVAALVRAEGVDRQAIIAALEAIHEVEYGLDIPAWKLVAAGKEVDEKAKAKRVYPPAAFGIPLFGQRVVLIYDNSLRSGDPHRFGSGDRLLELCKVPGSERPIFSARLLTVGQFVQAHFKRCIRDMPSGVKFDLITFNETIKPTFGRFVGAGAASRKAVDEIFDEIKPDNGIATYGVLQAALDLGGTSDAKAWKRGPDEIVFVTCNQPTTGAIKEADVVGAAIALKARVRMVRIHTIGILSHPYGMLETMAKETGGIYRNYYE